MRTTKFIVTKDHIKLARNIVFDWSNSEELPLGRLMMDRRRPYGDSDIPRSVADAIGMKGVEVSSGEIFLTPKQEGYCIKLHNEMLTVMQIIVSTGKFKTGTYESDYGLEWKYVE